MPTYCNELVVGGQVKFSLKNDTVTDPSHIMAGYIGHLADGRQVTGTGQGGPSATRHVMHFGFDDGTSSDVYVFYDDTLISNAITATKPATHGGKLVILAQLDGVTWYEPAAIPLNVQLVDYAKLVNQVYIGDDGLEHYNEWMAATDYIFVDPAMTFDYIGYQWFYIGFYDSSKAVIGAMRIFDDMTSADGEYGSGTLTPSDFPEGTRYIRISSVIDAGDTELSLIRTA